MTGTAAATVTVTGTAITEPVSPKTLDVLPTNHRRFLAFLERRDGSREDAEEMTMLGTLSLYRAQVRS